MKTEARVTRTIIKRRIINWWTIQMRRSKIKFHSVKKKKDVRDIFTTSQRETINSSARVIPPTTLMYSVRSTWMTAIKSISPHSRSMLLIYVYGAWIFLKWIGEAESTACSRISLTRAFLWFHEMTQFHIVSFACTLVLHKLS